MLQVNTKAGILEGIRHDEYTVFLGIPYAKPPVGALRWCPPQPAESWEGVRKAVHFPTRSMQEVHEDPFYDKEFYDEASYQTPVSEDSLYLNVWTPAKAADEKLPVAFWIHGGAFMGGFGHEKEFDGAAFCRRGVILVTINYRLGAMGFLAHPWLSKEQGGVSGNYGILDQIAALRWVYENIEAFGGDRDRITVMGQSAGGMSVQTLVSSPLTKGMIQGAILQSCLGLSYDHSLEKAVAEGQEISDNLGVQSLDELRTLPLEKLMEGAGPIIMRGFATMELPFTPVIDGRVLQEGYNAARDEGHVAEVPYLIGSNLNDIAVDPEALARGERGKVYHAVDAWAEARVNHSDDRVYAYDFVRQLPGNDAGAFHSAELWYMFGTLDRCWRPMTEADHALSERMLDYWTNFIKTGSPNGPGLPHWAPWAQPGDRMVFDV